MGSATENTLVTSRRGFIGGLFALAVTAPTIVRASSLMPVKRILNTLNPSEWSSLVPLGRLGYGRIENSALIIASQEEAAALDLAFRNTFSLPTKPSWLKPLQHSNGELWKPKMDAWFPRKEE